MALYGVQTTISYVAWDTANNAGKTGDVGNHTLRWIKDGTSSAPDNSPAEVDATNAPGVYKVTLTATECEAVFGTLAGKSGTADISVMPVSIAFERLPNAAPGAANGVFIAGENAPVKISGAGSALTLESTGGNGHGLEAQGNGTGEGVKATGGVTGNGIEAVAGATSGSGFVGTAPTAGDGMTLTGAGGGYDLNADIHGTLDTVTTCTTTTTNTDMVGTNGANTTVPDAAGVVATALGDGTVVLAGAYDAAKTAAQAGDLMLADVTKIHGSALTETSGGYLAAAFVKLFDVATPVLVASTVMRGTDSAALAATALTDVTWTDAKAAFLDASIAAIPTTAMRGTDNAALAATALTDVTWTDAKAAFLDASIAAIPTTAMRGTDNAALAATALSTVTWTAEKAGFIDASIAAIPTTAMRGTDNAALAATALSTVVWTNAKAAFLDASIAAIPTTAMRGTDNAALAATALTDVTWTDAKAAFLDASIAAIPTTAMRGTDNANTTTPPTATAIADAVLARDVSNAEPTGDEHTLRLIILELTESNTADNAGKLTIYQTDGATEVVQKTITDDATADPVTGIA